MAKVQLFKNLFQIVKGALGTGNEFAPAGLFDEFQAAAHLLAIEVSPVPLSVSSWRRTAQELGQEYVGQCFEDLCRSAVENVGDSNFESGFVPLDKAVGVRELAEFNSNRGRRRPRLEF